MDPFSHYMVAWLLGRSLKLSDGRLRALTFFSMFPDLDVVLIFFGFDFMTHFHGTYTHMVFFIMPLSLAIGYIFYLKFKKLYLKEILGGMFLHLGLDSLNATIIPVWSTDFLRDNFFYPLINKNINLGLIGIDDPLRVKLKIALLGVFIAIFIIKVIKKDYPWKVWTGAVFKK